MIYQIISSKIFYIFNRSQSAPSITIVSIIKFLPFIHHKCRWLIFVHFHFLNYNSLFSLHFSFRKLRINNHISQNIHSFFHKIRSRFHIISSVSISCKCIKLSTKRIYSLSNLLRCFISNSSFKKIMFQKMTNSIIFPIFIYTTSPRQNQHCRRI